MDCKLYDVVADLVSLCQRDTDPIPIKLSITNRPFCSGNVTRSSVLYKLDYVLEDNVYRPVCRASDTVNVFIGY